MIRCAVLSFFFISASLTAAEPPIRPATPSLPEVPEPRLRVGGELQSLDHLIEVTQQHLKTQKELRVLLERYLAVRERYLNNMDDNQLAMQMVSLGSQLSGQVKQHHLAHLFSQEFISELNMCHQISTKN